MCHNPPGPAMELTAGARFGGNSCNSMVVVLVSVVAM